MYGLVLKLIDLVPNSNFSFFEILTLFGSDKNQKPKRFLVFIIFCTVRQHFSQKLNMEYIIAHKTA